MSSYYNIANNPSAQWAEYDKKNADIMARAKVEKAAKEQAATQSQRQTIGDFMKTADPFAPQRNQYGTRLSDLMGMGGGGSSPAVTAPAGGQQVTALGGRMMPAATAAPAASPTAPSSGASRLSDVMQSNPFFQANMDAGQEAAKRRLAQMGMGTSGNAALELQRAAQASMSGDYFRMADLLGRFSGANVDPSSGASAGMQAWNQIENTRRFDAQNTPKQYWAGQLQNPTPAPLTLGNLSSYWGA